MPSATGLIRVFLAGMPPMLRGIVSETVTREPDMIVVGELDSADALSGMLPTTDADVFIIGRRHANDAVDPVQFLLGRPQTCVLMVEGNGQSADMYELVPHRTACGDVSPQSLVNAIRAGASGAARRVPPI